MRGAQGYRDRGPVRGASRSRSMRRSASFSLSPPPRSLSPRPRSDSRSQFPAADLRPAPVTTARRRRKKRQPLPSISRSPPPAKPSVKRDAFGRSTAQRRKYGEKSFSSEDGGLQRRSESRSSSPGERGKGFPMPGWPGMFPMAMGGKGFPFPGMMDPAAMWEASKQWANGMQAASFPMPWAGLAAAGASGARGREASRSRSRRRANKSRSRSAGRVNDSISVPKAIMGRVIGKQGATIKEIREASGARVDAEDVTDERCEFKISGTPEGIEIAKKMIRDVVDKTATGPGFDPSEMKNDGSLTTMILEFPAAATGRIIGSRGVKIAEVRHSSGAKVQIEKEDDKCKVHMAGTPDQLERAKALVSKLAEEIDDNFGKPGEGDDPVNTFIEFPAGATGAIIGSRGSKIAELRAKSGAKLQVEKLEDRCKVLLSGTHEAVEKAKELCRICVEESQERMASGAGRQQGHGSLEESMDVPQSMVGRVIGRGGETIQRIQRECGARLDVDTQCGDPCRVLIRGNQESVCHARFLISEVIEKGNLRSEGGTADPGPSFWPDPSYGFGGPPGYPADYADPWGMYGQLGSQSGAAHGQFKSLVDKNEIDMDEL